MNEHQKDRFTKRIISCLFHNLSNKRIAVLGFAFKKDTSDTRESPAITLVSNFVAEQAKVAIYDPKVKEEQIWRELIEYGGSGETLKLSVEICSSAYAACDAADAVVIMTEWEEFSNKIEEGGQSALKEISPNRLQVPERSTNREWPRETDPAACLKPLAENTVSARPSIHSLNAKVASLTNSSNHLDWDRIARGMRRPRYVFDGRNMLDHKKLEALGFRVEAIGKASRTYSPMQ